MGAMEELQKSHDELAHALGTIVGQMLGGSHGPTPAQLLLAGSTLRVAAPLIKNHLGTNAAGIADEIFAKVGRESPVPVSTPAPSRPTAR